MAFCENCAVEIVTPQTATGILCDRIKELETENHLLGSENAKLHASVQTKNQRIDELEKLGRPEVRVRILDRDFSCIEMNVRISRQQIESMINPDALFAGQASYIEYLLKKAWEALQ